MSETSTENRQIKTAKSFGVTVMYRLIVVALTFLNSILINRSLGVELRGGYTTISNWASLMQLFLNLGIGSAYPAIKRRYPEKSKDIFTTLTFIVAALYAVVFIAIGLFTGTNVKFTLAIAYMSTIGNLIIFIAIVEDVKKRNLINIATALLHALVLLIVFFFFKRNLNAVLWTVIIDHAVLGVALIVFNRITVVDFRLLNRPLLMDIFKIAVPAMLMNMLMYLNYHADVLFLSSITKDDYAVGLYGTAVTLGNMLWIIPDAFKDILYNRAARRDNPEEIVMAIVANIALCVVVLLGFTVLGKLFLRLVYGEDYVPAYPLVLLLFIGTLPMVLYKLIHPIYIANGKTKVVVMLLSIAVVANLIGNMILIPRYSGVGAAWASIVSYMICGIAFYIKFRKDYQTGLRDVPAQIRRLLKR